MSAQSGRERCRAHLCEKQRIFYLLVANGLVRKTSDLAGETSGLVGA
jgi:hypothetical protein